MGAATLAMALGLGGLMHSRTTVAGTALPLADADAATYGVSAVYQLDDTTYYVVGSKQGFQSEVQAGVTLNRDGNVLDVKILAQAETDSLVLLLFLVLCALACVTTRRLLAAVIIWMSYSSIMAILWMLLESPDLAVTEAAVGAGITSLLFFLALRKINGLKGVDRDEK